MTFRKLNKAQQILLKMRGSELYKNYKFLSRLHDLPIYLPDGIAAHKTEIHFRHSGNAGDIMYAIPAMYALAKNRKIHLHLNINARGDYGKMKHPLGTVMLNQQMADMLQPLVLNQPSFASCSAYHGEPVDVDLDQFRKYPFNYRTGNICRWYFLTFGINGDLSKPWLHALPDPSFKNTIVIARSRRYRNPGIDYSFLSQFTDTAFVGLPDEYEDMKKMIPNIRYVGVSNFLEMASVIAGSKFFIGNQSLPFSIAEGLKTKRILEVFHLSPNVIVEGSNGYDFCYQPQFEKIVREMD